MIIKKKIFNKELFKITSLNSISVLIKIFIGFVSSKVIALYVGPTGIALVGNLRNFLTVVENIGTLGFQNGIIKYTSEYERDKEKLNRFLSTVSISLLVIVLFSSGFIFLFSEFLNEKIFGNNYKYISVFSALAFGLPLYIISIYLMSVLNGFSQYRKVIYTTIVGNILGLIISVLLIYKYKILGALLAVVISPSVLFFVIVFFLKDFISLKKINLKFSFFDISIIKNLSEYSVMALVSSVLGPIVLISIRNLIINELGVENAGFCEAMSRISSYEFLFLSTILTVYFLPKLSKSINNSETKEVFLSYYKGIMPFFTIGLILLYFARELVISILFSKEFQPTSELFFWQLIGDFFKAMSLILGFQFFAKKMTKAFIISEIISFSVLWVFSVCLIPSLGIKGVVIAYAIDYFLYFGILLFFFRKIFTKKNINSCFF